MREYENNSSTNNENSENDTALSIATLIINLHTSFNLENFRLIEKYFLSFTKCMEAKVSSHTGDFGCGNEGRTPIMKTNRNKVAIYLRRNSLLIQDSGDKRQRGLAKSAAVSLKNVYGRQESLTFQV